MWWLAIPIVAYGVKEVYDYFTEDDDDYDVEYEIKDVVEKEKDKKREKLKQDIKQYKQKQKKFFKNKYGVKIKINDEYLKTSIDKIDKDEREIITISKHNDIFDKEIDKLESEISNLEKLILSLEEEKCKI